MSAGATTTGPEPERVGAWLSREVDPTIGEVTVRPMGKGHSNGAWLVDAQTRDAPLELVLKVPRVPSVVHELDRCREGDLLRELGHRGAPVPAVRAISRDDEVAGSPCFAMDRVPGTSVADDFPGAYHGPGWFRDCDAGRRRAVWESFHDRLAQLHGVEVAGLDAFGHGAGTRDVLDYWRRAVLAAVPAQRAPRQLAALDWLRANVPPDADVDAPAVCMGDARLVNGIVDGDAVVALVDFEVAYLGNPAADLAYSLFLDARHRAGVADPLDGIPGPDETWRRWGQATGRPTTHREYWTAFGATIICVTATRAMVQWGLVDGPAFRESDNALITDWELAIREAAR